MPMQLSADVSRSQRMYGSSSARTHLSRVQASEVVCGEACQQALMRWPRKPACAAIVSIPSRAAVLGACRPIDEQCDALTAGRQRTTSERLAPGRGVSRQRQCAIPAQRRLDSGVVWQKGQTLMSVVTSSWPRACPGHSMLERPDRDRRNESRRPRRPRRASLWPCFGVNS
jgi:hypothetical protein